MGNYTSAAAALFEQYETYRQASDKWNPNASGENLAAFDKYCRNKFPEATTLTQEMVDSWCKKRDTEKNGSCRTRIQVVVSCIKYLNSRGLCLLNPPVLPKERNRRQYVPHHFTDEELDDLFRRCDAHKAREESFLATEENHPSRFLPPALQHRHETNGSQASQG